jgi:hypothetical protein
MAEKDIEKKLFTLEEAEKLLPHLEQLVGGLIENRRSAVQTGERLIRIQEQIKQNAASVNATEMVNMQTELDFLVKVINDGLDAIEQLGAQPKDLDIGLVDFPAMLDGKEVLLCWKYGENSIRFYHTYEEGFPGRKPLIRRQ